MWVTPGLLRRLGLALALLIPSGSWLPADATTLSDGTFADADWVTLVVPRGPDGTSGGSGTQVASGGNPDAYREVFAT